MPGIINDRFLKMFDSSNEQLVSESAFVSNLVRVFMSDLDSRMRMTFTMYTPTSSIIIYSSFYIGMILMAMASSVARMFA